MEIVHSKTLDNGLKVVFAPLKVDSVTICLRGLAGSNYENPKQVGVAHFLEHLLLGISDKSSVLDVGGRITATTSRDDVAYLVKVLKKDLEIGVKYLSEVFGAENFESKTFGTIKNTIVHEIKQNKDIPSKHIGRIAYKIMYPGQRFEKLNTGDVEEVLEISLDEVNEFKSKYYSTGNFVLSICGDLEKEEVFQIAEELFNDFSGGEKTKTLKHEFAEEFAYQIENWENLNLMHLRIDYNGFKTSENDKYAALITSNLLKKALTKSLNEQPYIMDIASFSSNSYGLFGLYTIINPNFLSNFLTSFFTTLSNIEVKGLEKVKTKIHSDFVYALEKTSLRADYYSELYLYKNLSKNHKKEYEKIAAVTEFQVKKIFEKLLRSQPKITVLDKNLSKENFLSAYNRVKVTV